MFLLLVKIDKFKREQENEGRTFRRAEFPHVLNKGRYKNKSKNLITPCVSYFENSPSGRFLKIWKLIFCFLKMP